MNMKNSIYMYSVRKRKKTMTRVKRDRAFFKFGSGLLGAQVIAPVDK